MQRSKSQHRILVMATRNAGKITEIGEMLADTGWVIQSCDAFPGCPIPEETGRTFEENAVLKATAIAGFTGHLALADDSGLEVDALNGAPGIYSARFSGDHATDASNNALLLDRLKGIPDAHRTARFRCVIALTRPDGRCRTVDGVCEGRIGNKPGGTAGFGYDPLFIPDGYTLTFAELDADVKNRISHRGQAVRAACKLLRSI